MKQVLVVNAKAVAAAKVLVRDHMEVTTFQAATPESLKDKVVLLWPSAPGMDADKARALTAQAERAKTIGLGDKPKGWGPIEALAQGMQWSEFREWAPQRAVPLISDDSGLPETPIGDDPAPTEGQKQLVTQIGLAVNGQGNPYCNAANVVRFLQRTDEYKGHIWFDDFLQSMITDIQGKPEPWTDRASNDLMVYLQSHFAMHNLTPKHVEQAVSFFSEQDHRHEVRDWMKKLKWDKTPRIGDFFVTHMGATKTPAILSFGTNFWISMVKRVFRPGCQADYMVVLEGGQGIGKTRAMQIIGGPYYAEVGVSADSTDFERQLQGKMLVEISELNSFTKADQSRIKQIITKRDDHWVPKYKEHSVKHARQCILVGTTNESEWIKDQTGGRRFWPIKCGTIDLNAIENDRDQLFAEAMVALMSGEEGFIVPLEETIELQDDRREHDELEPTLREKLVLVDRVTLLEAAAHLGFTPDKFPMHEQKRIGNCLRRIGFVRTVLRNQGVLHKIWLRSQGVTGNSEVTGVTV